MLDQLLEQAGELPPLPEIYIRVEELLASDASSASDIGKVLQSDPALTARVLKLINSAFFGLSNEVTSIPQAISLLGRDQLKQVLVGSVLSGVVKDFNLRDFPLRNFWQHCIKSAIIGRQLAMQNARIIDHEAFFTIGLLHDIGWLVIAKVNPGSFMRISELALLENKDALEVEKDTLGVTHVEVGVALLQKWKMPELIIECVEKHHYKDQNGSYFVETNIISLANQLSRFELDEISVEVAFDAEDQESAMEKTLSGIANWEDSKCTSEQIAIACGLADEQWFEVMDTLGMNDFGSANNEDEDPHFRTSFQRM
ncbi:MAG: putative nucleotidyltransferase with HDIG domain [Planctomycetota bacterium]|jgi:putative nucleotidyltransferase with HDIG domain